MSSWRATIIGASTGSSCSRSCSRKLVLEDVQGDGGVCVDGAERGEPGPLARHVAERAELPRSVQAGQFRGVACDAAVAGRMLAAGDAVDGVRRGVGHAAGAQHGPLENLDGAVDAVTEAAGGRLKFVNAGQGIR